jgi:transcriptional regulator with XRE-family HTH domain
MASGEQLKRWRKPTGLTQRAAAIAAGISPWRLAAAELGELQLDGHELESLKSTYLEKIAENLDQVMGDLLRPADLVVEAAENSSNSSFVTPRLAG